MKLYGYWRSSATYRVRIALALKDIDYDYEPVNLLKGEQNSAAYLAKNPNGLVPTLLTDAGNALCQSLAIMEYLEDAFPAPPILPGDPAARATTRAIAATIACEAQPLMNLRIQKYLKEEVSMDDNAVKDWLNRWAGGAMTAVEKMIAGTDSAFCVGNAPTMADACLVPQWFSALRFGVDLSGLNRLNEIYERCIALPAFEKAHPLNQPDAVKE